MEHRPFPPSPRRLALARRAGLHAASPLVVAAAAWAAVLAATITVGRAAAARLGDAIAGACDGSARWTMAAAPRAVLGLIAPIVVAAGLAAAIAHVAQTRALWLPRRRVDGAPAVRPTRTARGGFELASAAVIGATCLGWLWLVAPRIAAADSLAPAAALLASFAGAVAVALVALAVVDALARRVALAGALAMTPADKRADDRLAAADPRWRSLRAGAARTPRLVGATLVVVGDDAAVAIAWDPTRAPVPTRIARGRGTHAVQLRALARRDRVAIHRDAALAARLVDGDGAVPERDWPRLAELVAATRGHGNI